MQQLTWSEAVFNNTMKCNTPTCEETKLHGNLDVCKRCYNKTYFKEYYIKHKEKIIEKNKAWNAQAKKLKVRFVWSRKHPSCIECGTSEVKHSGSGLCIRCYQRKYNKQNPEKAAAKQKRYYFKDIEKSRARSRENLRRYVANHPEYEKQRYQKKLRKAGGF